MTLLACPAAAQSPTENGIRAVLRGDYQTAARTELATEPARALPRHFTEAFAWQPGPNAESWKLRWQIFEIVDDDVIPIDTPENVVTVAGVAPPSWDVFDVRKYAVLRVDDQGNADHVYAEPQRQFDFCSDLRTPMVDGTGPQTWRAVAGTMTIELSPPGLRARAPHLRRATITSMNLVAECRRSDGPGDAPGEVVCAGRRRVRVIRDHLIRGERRGMED